MTGASSPAVPTGLSSAAPIEPQASRPKASIPLRGLSPYGPEHPDYPNAPSDWDGGPYLCRDGKMYYMCGYGWQHGLGCWNRTSDWDRIAYRAKAQVSA